MCHELHFMLENADPQHSQALYQNVRGEHEGLSQECDLINSKFVFHAVNL